MIDKVDGGIGVVAEGDFLVHENFVRKGVEHFGLFVLGRVGRGGVFGAAEGVVFLWTPVAGVQGCGEGGDSEGEERQEGYERHVEWEVAADDDVGFCA